MADGHHHHHHHHDGKHGRRRMAATLALTISYMVAEVVGGILSGSLALLADAGHMLSDAVALTLALVAMKLAERPPDARRTYGYARTQILAALLNGGALLAIAISVVVEARERLAVPPEVRAPIAMGVAAGGLLVNLVALRILHGSKDESLNTRGAWLHVASDALGSVGALASAAAIWAWAVPWADPVASLLIALLVAYSGWTLVRDTTHVLMEGVPPHLDVESVGAAIAELDGISGVHDLHIWTIDAGTVLCSVHVVAEGALTRTVGSVAGLLRERFDIHHTTVQVEDAAYASSHCSGCELAPDH
ncbi:MAG: cation diffusion facilitator family transporter [Polyangiaceae bacterium]